MNLFYQPLIPKGISHLDSEESKHCIKVLRRGKGDVLRITDGKGFYYDVVITKADAHQCDFEITAKIQEVKRNYNIHIAISPTKNTDRIEWFVEKAVEIGIDQISFIACKNTERPFLKLERLEKMAITAMKQSLKATLPTLAGLIPFADLVNANDESSSKFIAFVDEANPNHLQSLAKPNHSYVVLIGPEGDFSNKELELASTKGFQKVSLGLSRLRTETAGMVACTVLNLINQR